MKTFWLGPRDMLHGCIQTAIIWVERRREDLKFKLKSKIILEVYRQKAQNDPVSITPETVEQIEDIRKVIRKLTLSLIFLRKMDARLRKKVEDSKTRQSVAA